MTSAPTRLTWRRVWLLLAMSSLAWLVHVYGRTLPDWGAVIMVAMFAGAIALGLHRRRRMERAAFVAAYVRADSRWVRWLSGRWWLGLRSALLAAVLAPILATALIRTREAAVWTALVLTAPLLALIFAAVMRALERHANALYLPALAWRLAAAVVGSVLLIALIIGAFHRAYPDLAEVGLERAVWHFVDQERARSAFVEVLLQIAAAKDALRLWLAQQLMPQPGGSLAQAAGWVIVLAEEALFVWSYLLWLCPAVLPGPPRTGARDEERV